MLSIFLSWLLKKKYGSSSQMGAAEKCTRSMSKVAVAILAMGRNMARWANSSKVGSPQTTRRVMRYYTSAWVSLLIPFFRDIDFWTGWMLWAILVWCIWQSLLTLLFPRWKLWTAYYWPDQTMPSFFDTFFELWALRNKREANMWHCTLS